MLSIVATPIGNIGDITLRAIETLRSCNAIICEDTRVTGNLLKLLKLPKKELMSFHGYSDAGKADAIVERLKRGQHLALVSDAGTPGISDPGFAVVRRVQDWNNRASRKSVGQEYSCPTDFIPIEVIPGPAAFLAALSASGLSINQFVYLGFLPLKKGRKTLLASLREEERTVVFYESVHRIRKTLHELASVLSGQPSRPVVIARELTKVHEEVIATTIGELAGISEKIMKKGEFVVVLGPLP
jgi:16S rRNA (cytidine1402-2'-O)-methyltransferase